MFRLALILFFFVSTSAVYGAGVEGSYTCQGKNPNGSNYKGHVEIKKAGDAYVITWNISGQKHSGIGLLLDNVFSTTWSYAKDPRQSGITTYKLQPNGQLKGKWISVRGNRVNPETLTPARAKPKAESPLKDIRIFK